MDNYDFKSAVTEYEMQFYMISYADQSSEYSVTINGFDYETGRGFCYMAYANDGLTRREANCRIEYDDDLNKFKFFALKTIHPWEELLWSYDDIGVWWFERREVLPKLVYQEAVNIYLKHTHENVAQGLESPNAVSADQQAQMRTPTSPMQMSPIIESMLEQMRPKRIRTQLIVQ